MVVTSPGRLFVCGTNSFRPLCHTYIINDYNYTLEATKNGQAVCPYDPKHNSTSVFAGEYHCFNPSFAVPLRAFIEMYNFYAFCDVVFGFSCSGCDEFKKQTNVKVEETKINKCYGDFVVFFVRLLTLVVYTMLYLHMAPPNTYSQRKQQNIHVAIPVMNIKIVEFTLMMIHKAQR